MASAAVLTIAATAGPVGAHGVGGRTDLPLPAWQLAWAAAFAVLVSFVALGVFWSEPRLAKAAAGGRLLDCRSAAVLGLLALTRAAGVAALGVLLSAAWLGNPSPAVNIAEDAFLIWFWVGLQLASVILGDVWRLFNPYATIADGAAWLKARLAGTPMSPQDHGRTTLWPATAAIGAYLWYELAYHSPDSPRSIAVFLSCYSGVMLGGAALRGRGFVRTADGFAVLFERLAHVAPLFAADGRLRVRIPLSGLAVMPRIVATVPFVLVVLGATTFDGFGRSAFWVDFAGAETGWSRTLAQSFGLVATVGLVALAYALAISATGSISGERPSSFSPEFGPSLVPIAAAYGIAHYFSLLVLEGQGIFIAVSDPFGRGWDLFGTKDYAIDWTLVSPAAVAWVQTCAIALGHVMAVAAAHDVAISRFERPLAVRSQYPILALMVLYTVVGLLLLLGL